MFPEFSWSVSELNPSQGELHRLRRFSNPVPWTKNCGIQTQSRFLFPRTRLLFFKIDNLVPEASKSGQLSVKQIQKVRCKAGNPCITSNIWLASKRCFVAFEAKLNFQNFKEPVNYGTLVTVVCTSFLFRCEVSHLDDPPPPWGNRCVRRLTLMAYPRAQVSSSPKLKLLEALKSSSELSAACYKYVTNHIFEICHLIGGHSSEYQKKCWCAIGISSQFLCKFLLKMAINSSKMDCMLWKWPFGREAAA